MLHFSETGTRTLPDLTEADDGWVDEAFGGHTQLAILDELPTYSESAVERILGHLPGLVDLTVLVGLPMSTRLLAALARSCPGLQVLRCSISEDCTDPDDLAVLAPLSGSLKRLNLRGWKFPSPAALAALVRSLSVVPVDPTGLPGPWLCHLEALSLAVGSDPFSARLFQLLAANQNTLHNLTLTLYMEKYTEEVAPLVAALRALPHLTRLRLTLPGARCSFSALLSPDLVDRLEHLHVWLSYTTSDRPVCLTSSRLQRLRLSVEKTRFTLVGLELHCPALMELDLTDFPGPLTSLQCPRLRSMKMLGQNMDWAAPMPDLEVVEPPWLSVNWEDPVWLLSGPALPRLRVLSGVRLTRPDLLARLCACGSLVRLEQLHLNATRLPNPLVLRLPGQLERLDLHIEMKNHGDPPPPLDLRVEASGLVSLSLAIDGNSLAASVSLQGTPATQPRTLSVDGCIQMASLLGLLTGHGARLRDFTSRRLPAVRREDWPRLMGAVWAAPTGQPHDERLRRAIPSVACLSPPAHTLLARVARRDQGGAGLPAAGADLGCRGPETGARETD
ncbi:hypothetical protein PAPYR_497 [Paratrimastix pyriformis]|uniref:Uncharacterized protein n=1 Tax=Paratrimastix pyriformis TaxID=342808 RepID=A0ABQ8V0D0_9EUKA|nr:hypothetical protein PAPYR_497 [Paratrimastix pyriformis]